MAQTIEIDIDIIQISKKAKDVPENAGKPSTFIPKKLDITVGIAKIIVIAVKKRITKFRLFDIIDEMYLLSALKLCYTFQPFHEPVYFQ